MLASRLQAALAGLALKASKTAPSSESRSGVVISALRFQPRSNWTPSGCALFRCVANSGRGDTLKRPRHHDIGEQQGNLGRTHGTRSLSSFLDPYGVAIDVFGQYSRGRCSVTRTADTSSPCLRGLGNRLLTGTRARCRIVFTFIKVRICARQAVIRIVLAPGRPRIKRLLSGWARAADAQVSATGNAKPSAVPSSTPAPAQFVDVAPGMTSATGSGGLGGKPMKSAPTGAH